MYAVALVSPPATASGAHWQGNRARYAWHAAGGRRQWRSPYARSDPRRRVGCAGLPRHVTRQIDGVERTSRAPLLRAPARGATVDWRWPHVLTCRYAVSIVSDAGYVRTFADVSRTGAVRRQGGPGGAPGG